MVICNANCKIGSVMLPKGGVTEPVVYEENDDAVIGRLCVMAEDYDLQGNGGRRLECCLVLEEMSSLWLLWTRGIPDRLSHKADIMATTPDDLLAKSLLVRLPGMDSHFPALDRAPVLYSSQETIHLVLFGASQLTEAMAVNAALVAHYPNYTRDTSLRTRITIVDDHIVPFRDRLLQHYQHLFENSFYRTIDLNSTDPQTFVHHPMYEAERKDFVDVEWEFVNGAVGNSVLRQKLSEWSVSDRQHLTLALCYPDMTRNMETAFSMPDTIYANQTPVLCYTSQQAQLQLACEDGRCGSIHPFSHKDSHLHTLYSLKRMAKMVNYIYTRSFSLGPDEPVTAPAHIEEAAVEEAWASLTSFSNQYSNFCNAMALGAKMHSAGLSTGDWQSYYALSRDEILQLSEVEHNRWSVEKLLLGYRPVTKEEQQAVEADIAQKALLKRNRVHYDLRAYSDLRSDATGKNVNVYDMALTQSIPLIIKTCITD